jgi:hypothetical protein
MRLRSSLGMLLITFALTSSADAATLLVNASGILTGATGVNVGGTLYDVEFVDGTCAAVFDGCDGFDDFAFGVAGSVIVVPDPLAARDASEALLSQVFLNTALGDFDSQPALTFGCGLEFAACDVLTPYGFADYPPSHEAPPGSPGFTVLFFGEALNFAEGVDVDFAQASGRFPFPDTTNVDAVYARWTEQDTEPVPEPATVILLGLGLAAMGVRSRRHGKHS